MSNHCSGSPSPPPDTHRHTNTHTNVHFHHSEGGRWACWWSGGKKKLLLRERERKKNVILLISLHIPFVHWLLPPFSPSFPPRLIRPLTSACMRAHVHPICVHRGLGCPHLRLLVVALGDLVVDYVHQPDLGLLVSGLAAEDLDKTAGNISVWEVEEEEVVEK